uniref:RNA polymerase sigma factor n=1 Tax=Kofleria flava TaxID=694315 RepID=A0A3S5GXN6_9BACT|nr:RNA polymerase sigma factor [Kofleria flava]
MPKHLDHPEPENDSALLHAWQDGDQAAGTALVRKHFSLVYRFFRSKLDKDIDGLVERTFLACRESGERYRDAPSMRAYLLGIARSQLLLCVHVYTQGRVRSASEVVQGGAGPRPLRPEPERPPERPHLLAALRALPVDLQIAIELYYWEDLAIDEVASVLDVPPGTVKSHLSRARKELKDHLALRPPPPSTARTTPDAGPRSKRAPRALVSEGT